MLLAPIPKAVRAVTSLRNKYAIASPIKPSPTTTIPTILPPENATSRALPAAVELSLPFAGAGAAISASTGASSLSAEAETAGEVFSAARIPARAANVVLPFEFVATYIPMYPAVALQSAPRMNANAAPRPRADTRRIATTPTNGASHVYSFFKNAIAPA